MSRSTLALWVLSACVPQRFAPFDAGPPPQYLAAFTTGSHDASGGRVPAGAPVQVVPPTDCDTRCEAMLVELRARLTDEGHVTEAEEAPIRLVFDRVRVDDDAPVPPTGLELFTVGPDGQRAALPVSAEVGDACRAIAQEAGTSTGPYVSLSARALDAATGEPLLTWSYEAGLPARTELVYVPALSSTATLPPYPTPPFNGTQSAGMIFSTVGLTSFAGTGALWWMFGRGWSEESHDLAPVALATVPLVLTGFVLVGVGNARARKNPVPIPADHQVSWDPPEALLCRAAPTRRDRIWPEGQAAGAPEPAPSPTPDLSTSFSLRPQAAAPAPADARTDALLQSAVDDLVRSLTRETP